MGLRTLDDILFLSFLLAVTAAVVTQFNVSFLGIEFPLHYSECFLLFYFMNVIEKDKPKKLYNF